MFKSTRWRSDKNKIKVVFKLQFHATQVAGDTLIISVIPADIGKSTRKLEKAKIKDGSCCWEKPHYETVKFVQDPTNGKFHEKIYHFVLATGSSKSSAIGEVSIDFASYAEATQISSLALPLGNADCSALLHVSVQRVQDSLNQRDVDESENINRQDRSLRAQLSNSDIEESNRSNPSDDPGILSNKVNRDRRGSSGSDITMSGSDSSSGLDTLLEPEAKKTKPTHEPLAMTIYEERVSQWDWLDGSPPETSTDDSSPSPGEPLLDELPEDGSPEAVIKKLKMELEVLARQADVSELELQTLRKQIVKERKRGQDLSREVAELHEERNSFKEECEQLKADKKSYEGTKVKVNNKLLTKGGDLWDLVDELREELTYEKELNSNLQIQLQKTQESNAELILAVQDLDSMLEQKDSEMSKSRSKSRSCISREFEEIKSETDDDEDQKALEEIVREHCGMQDTYLLEQKITELYGEIELYKKDKSELEMQMDQIALDYEILKQGNSDMCYKLEQSQLQEQLKMQYEFTSYSVVHELETQIESLNKELEMKSEKLSKTVLIIKELETYVRSLEKDLEDQACGFEADTADLMNAKVEQEQRAIRAEETLRKTKMKNANTAERLQEKFKRLSTQMTSSFEANEKVAIKAMDEANKLRVEKRYLEEMLKKFEHGLDGLSACFEEKMADLLSQITQKSKQIEDISHKLEFQKTSYRDEIKRLESEKQNLEAERKDLENSIKKKHGDYEVLESRYDDMKVSFLEYENEKEKLKKQISLLKTELKKCENALTIMEKKVKDSSKTVTRNNPHSSKEVTNLKNKIELLEGQIKLKETALRSSENMFLEKENDLNHKIKELERRLVVLDESTAVSQASTADEMALLTKLNKSMEVELMEMQERYLEISLKFAEVEGERQQLVMTLRNLKNAKKC
nr:hypothetical protein [Tanacetum cinerariifolium]